MVIPLNPDEITDVERRQSLEAVKLIKKKINGIIKVRTCANESKQKRYLKEVESVTLIMVSMEGLFTLLVIYAYKGREVANFDVLGAYLHANMPKDKKVLLKSRETLVYIMYQINLENKKNVRY